MKCFDKQNAALTGFFMPWRMSSRTILETAHWQFVANAIAAT